MYIKVFMIKYLRYSIHEILSTLHGLNTVITLQYPWYSIHMTLSTLMYPWHSINFTVSVKSIHYIVFTIQRNRENEDNILISHMFKAFELYWSSILLQESPWVTSLLIWVMKFFVCCFSWLQYTGFKLWVLAVPTISWLYFHFTARGECVTRLHLKSIFTVTILD